jgi:hypothetical protein
VGCTVGAPTIAGSVALQVHGATTAVAGAKNLGKVLSEIVSVVFASSSASGAGNNPGSLGNGNNSSSGSAGNSAQISGNASWAEPKISSPAHPDLPVFKEGGKTSGIFSANRQQVKLHSGTAGPGQELKSQFGQLGKESEIALKHVEGHAAALMKKHDIKEATVFINHPKGACYYCQIGIPALLDSNSKLWVVSPKGVGYFTKNGFTLVK